VKLFKGQEAGSRKQEGGDKKKEKWRGSGRRLPEGD